MIHRVLLIACAAIALSSFAQTLPKPDIVVAADGSGDFKTVQAAVGSIAATNRERIVVFVKNGVYREKVRVDAAFVTLRGESRPGTRIEFPQLAEDFTNSPDKLGRAVINVTATTLCWRISPPKTRRVRSDRMPSRSTARATAR
jgi:pectin methylesterase-like acyl-CoA thioesterase